MSNESKCPFANMQGARTTQGVLLDIDLPFVDDGLRVYAKAEERQHFFDLCKAELEERDVRFALIQGDGEERVRAALEAIAAHC